jgi:hypothetical protein
MKNVVGAVSVIALLLLGTGVLAQNTSRTPTQEYSALLKQYTPASGGMRNATTDLHRKAAVDELAPFARKFLDLAEKHSKNAVALSALRQAIQAVVSTDSAAQNAWEINDSNFPNGISDGSAARSVAITLRDHLLSAKLAPIIDRMRYGYRRDYGECLSTILDKNPHREIQGLAGLALAQFLSDRLRMLELVEDRAELAECYRIVFGKEYLTDLQQLGRAELATRIEALFQQVDEQYGDVKFRSGTLGQVAKSELYAIRQLGVGKVAPETEGKDQDGNPFKLSDYRGKVVLLYFWSEF